MVRVCTVILTGTTDSEIAALEVEDVRSSVAAFMKTNNPFTRHRAVSALCALGHRGDTAQKMLDRIVRISRRIARGQSA